MYMKGNKSRQQSPLLMRYSVRKTVQNYTIGGVALETRYEDFFFGFSSLPRFGFLTFSKLDQDHWRRTINLLVNPGKPFTNENHINITNIED